ncbi:MAG: GntR family transcriptional regulator [Synergistetes bacterium]|nr:GntR family transcriptional regulator [Synergistota bacterium]MDW8192154.1 GntR family transcriptional regulator [Synergistota bacterium]
MIVYKTKVEAVYEKLRENIVSGVYKPGERLVIGKIAQELGVSETPIREALRILEREGLVEIRSHVGPVVRGVEDVDIMESYIIRGVLEGFAAREGVDRFTEKDFKRLEELLGEMRKALENKDYVRYGNLNKEFHAYICSLNPYKKLYELIMELWNRWERTRAVFMLSPDRGEESLLEHEKIVELIKNKKKEELETFIREHRKRAAESFIKALKESKFK